MELRQKLFLVLGLMAVVPLLFLLFSVVDRVERQLEQQASVEIHERLAMLSREVTTLLETQKAVALALGEVPEVRGYGASWPASGGDGQRLAEFFLRYQHQMPSIQALRFIDAEGKTRVKVKEGHQEPTPHRDARGVPYVEDLQGRPFLTHAMLPGVSVGLSDFELGKAPGEADFCPSMVRYTVPLRDAGGDLLGMLVVNMWGRQVDATVQASVSGHPGEAYMVEISEDPARDGIYLYHQNDARRFANQLGTEYRFARDVGETLWNRMRADTGAGTLRTDDGRMLFYRHYTPDPARPAGRWLLVIEAERSDVIAPVAALRQWIWGLMAAVLILALLSARWVAARLARPVHELADMIIRYADGDHRVRYRDRRRDEVGSAGRAFNYLAQNLEQAERGREEAERVARQAERLASVGELAAGIGHEINNPLMNIMSLAALVQESLPEDAAEAREDLRLLQAEGQRCARIVQGILNFARENPPSYQCFDIAALLEETAALLRHRLEAARVHLKLDVQGAPLRLEGDPNQLQQALVNLLLNAVQASPANSFITMRAAREDAHLRVDILDNGPGIAREDMARVFDPFFSTKTDSGGTGLGLSVSYGIVKRHGGEIVLANRDHGGLRASIELPVAATAASPASEVRHAG
ncbi:sensor histidine kinase [Ectothiorhodospiraceae bacterium 2226]|nr:sensor histidine kinase [Ectothiorhodospiraceae bacterium 2226]